jgi:putative spermidine/putrescine transport system permease protein
MSTQHRSRATGCLPHSWETVALYVMALVVLVFLAAPILVVIPMSFSPSAFPSFPPEGFSLRWYAEFFAPHSQWIEAILNSVQIASGTAFVATVLGTSAALGLSRLRSRFALVVAISIVLPLVIPVVVVAIAVYLVYTPLRLNGTMLGVMLAHTTITTGLPFMAVSAALRTYSIDLERAAQSLGATPLQTFGRVTLPLIAPAVLSGALLAFIISWDEILIALFISGFAKTLPRLMWEQVRFDLTPTIAAASTLLILVSILLLALAEILRRYYVSRVGGRMDP